MTKSYVGKFLFPQEVCSALIDDVVPHIIDGFYSVADFCLQEKKYADEYVFGASAWRIIYNRIIENLDRAVWSVDSSKNDLRIRYLPFEEAVYLRIHRSDDGGEPKGGKKAKEQALLLPGVHECLPEQMPYVISWSGSFEHGLESVSVVILVPDSSKKPVAIPIKTLYSSHHLEYSHAMDPVSPEDVTPPTLHRMNTSLVNRPKILKE